MTKKVYRVLIFLFTVHCSLFILSYAQVISSKELIENAKYYDGKEITFEGEVIGDIMERGDFCWINLNDGKSAIGVWLKKDMAKEIEYKGSYRFKGDWVRIRGIFNRNCFQHGGNLDIHAISLERIKKGHPVQEKLDSSKLNLSMKLGGILLCLIILNLYKRRQRKR